MTERHVQVGDVFDIYVSRVKGYRDDCLNVARVERKASFVIGDVGRERNEQLCYRESALQQ
jgi:hypothetical protein